MDGGEVRIAGHDPRTEPDLVRAAIGGYGVYEAQFDQSYGGWPIREAVVAADGLTYRRGSDAYESLMLELLIGGVLLHRWDDELWQRIQQHRG